MVEGERQRQDSADDNVRVMSDRLVQQPADPEDGHLRQVQHRRGKDTTNGPVIADGKRPAAQIGERNTTLPG